MAIGASRTRIVTQLMTESLLIALAGGALGLIITAYAAAFFSEFRVPGDIPIQFSFQIDHRVVAFTLLLSVLSAVLFGLVPPCNALKPTSSPA